MITFYPRDMARWRKEFDFTPDITLIPKEKTDYKVFYNRDELIGFLKEHGVRLDDPQHPLKIESVSDEVYTKGHSHQGELFVVVQWTVLGWIRDNYV